MSGEGTEMTVGFESRHAETQRGCLDDRERVLAHPMFGNTAEVASILSYPAVNWYISNFNL